MSISRLSLAELPWLPRASADLRARLRAIEDDADLDWGPRLQRLAGEYLGLNQALTLAKAHDRLRARAVSPSLTDFRLGLVSTASTDFLKPFLVASGLRHGLSIQVIAADFGQLVQEALDPESQINQAKPHAVLLAVDHRGLPLRRLGASDWPLFATDVALEQLTLVRDGFRRNSGAACVVQTLPNAPALLFGSLDAATAGTLRAAIAAINARLVRDVPERGDVLLDVDWLAQSVGLDQWYDERHWYLARMACAQQALPLYADFAARTLAAMRGKSRKCLILDLDNTLWGGVIGDDGIDGIALAPGDAQGEAFRAIQQTAPDLRRRGVVLAVCSKNDEAMARLPFRSHPAWFSRRMTSRCSSPTGTTRPPTSSASRAASNSASMRWCCWTTTRSNARRFGSAATGRRAGTRRRSVRLRAPAAGRGYFESVSFTTRRPARARTIPQQRRPRPDAGRLAQPGRLPALARDAHSVRAFDATGASASRS